MWAEVMEEEEKLGQRSIDAGSSTRSFTPPSVMHLSAADKAWQSRRLRVMFSPTPALLPRAVSALSLHSQRFLNTMPELLRKSNKKIWQREQTQRGHLKNWTQAAIHFAHGKALQIQKKGAHASPPPAWVYWHGPELLLWLKSSLSVGSHVPCYEMYPLLLVSSRYVAYRVWNNGLHCWQPVLREGEMGRGARTSCLPPDSPMQQHEKKKKSNEKKQKEKEKCQRKNRKRSQVRGHSHKWRNCRQSGFVRCWSA